MKTTYPFLVTGAFIWKGVGLITRIIFRKGDPEWKGAIRSLHPVRRNLENSRPPTRWTGGIIMHSIDDLAENECPSWR